jgi:Na+/melibiose symporter-like transporter
MSHKNVFVSIQYALPRVATISLYAPINIVQGVYAKYYAISLTSIATAILVIRLFDAFTDPLIGHFSDKSQATRGTRKPYLATGGAILAMSGYFLYSPPSNPDIWYLSIWFVFFYVGYTLFEIPHLAWGGELSLDTHQKTQTFFIRALTSVLGTGLFYSIPLLPMWNGTDITPDTLRFSALLSCGLLIPLLYFCLRNVPPGGYQNAFSLSDNFIDKRVTLRKKLAFVFDNRPLMIFLGAFVFSGCGLGMWFGLLYIYVDPYLGMGSIFAKVYLISLALNLISPVIWERVAKHVGKKRTWVAALVLALVSFFISYILTPVNSNFLYLVFLLVINSASVICIEAVSQSMLSDIVDYSTVKYGDTKGSTYFSLYIFTYKAVFALGGALGLAIAGWFGFDPSSASNDATAVGGLKVAMALIPCVFVSIGIAIVLFSPISEHKHSIIRRKLIRTTDKYSQM